MRHFINILTGLTLCTFAQALSTDFTKEYPLGSEIENLVLRPSGSIITTIGNSPHLYEVDAVKNASPKLIHTFDDTAGASGISASSEHDKYFVITGNFSFQTFTPTPGSYAIHQLSYLECGTPVVKRIASLAPISQPNGMVTVPNSPNVLIADCRGGFIYRFNTKTRKLDTYFDHPLLKPKTDDQIIFGVNGVKFSRGYLYFSNTDQMIVARIKATGMEQRLTGNPEIVASMAAVDDFTVDDRTGDLYLAEQGTVNGIGFVARKAYGAQPKTIVGGPTNKDFLGPTAAIWAKGAVGKKLVVSLTGGFEQFFTKNYTGGYKVAIVNLD